MSSRIRIGLAGVLTALLAVAFGGPGALAQEQPVPDSAPYEHALDDFLREKSLWLAQLHEQSEDSGFQPGRGYVRGQGRQRAYDHARDRVRQHIGRKFDKHIEQFRILKLLELLDLQEDQELEFITLFHSMRRDRRQLHESKTELLEQLGNGLREQTIADDEINRLVVEIQNLGRQESRKIDDFLIEARKILSPEQVGRFIVFQERFEFELLKAVKTFREDRQGRFGQKKQPGPVPSGFEKDSF